MKSGTFYYSTAVLVLIVTLASCNRQDFLDDIHSVFDGKDDSQKGFVYTMSNDAGQNSIISYLQSSNGRLTYKASTPSGGAGNGAGLGSQGSLVLDKDHQWLFAVNAGGNSVSSFKVKDDGSLTLAHTVSSNGTMPISVTVYGNWLYVVNSVSANISGFTIGAGGTMTLIPGSNRALSVANAGPAQISFKPGGQYLVVTEKTTNKISTFPVNALGVTGAPNMQTSAGLTPFGFDFSGSNYIVVAEAGGGVPNGSTVSSYSITNTANLASGPIATKQSAACWTDVSKDGKYAFVTNAGSNTISSFVLNNSGILLSVNEVAAGTDKSPIDITLSGNESFVYNVNSVSHTITEYKKGANASLTRIGEIIIPDHAVGIAAW
jgi:6-phosphogluconolactonase (cycloisomerase 2 family)